MRNMPKHRSWQRTKLRECRSANFLKPGEERWPEEMAGKSRTLHGEAASVDVEKATEQIDFICTLITAYDLDHVYIMDETGLFFRCLPNRSYVKRRWLQECQRPEGTNS